MNKVFHASMCFGISVVLLTSCTSTSQQNQSVSQTTPAPTVRASTDELLAQMTETISSETRRIGVTTPEGEGGTGEILQDEIIASFLRARLPGVEIYERSRLNAILEEAEFGISGLVSDETAVRLGEMVGVDALVVGSYRHSGTSVSVNVRLIDATSGRIIGAGSVEVPIAVVQPATGPQTEPTLFEREYTVRELVLRSDIQPDPDVAVSRITTYGEIWTEYDRSDRMIGTGEMDAAAPGQFSVSWTFPDMGVTYYNYHRTADSIVARIIADDTEIGYIAFVE